jgi:hypothetical protein
VLHSIKKIDSELNVKKELKNTVEKIIQRLKST